MYEAPDVAVKTLEVAEPNAQLIDRSQDNSWTSPAIAHEYHTTPTSLSGENDKHGQRL